MKDPGIPRTPGGLGRVAFPIKAKGVRIKHGPRMNYPGPVLCGYLER